MQNRIAAALLGSALFMFTIPALAADFAATPESDAYRWNGPYLGANLQYTTGHAAASYTDPGLAAFGLDSDPSGWAGGITLGANQQLPSGVVIGVEGDIDYGSVTSTIPDTLGDFLAHPGGPHFITATTDWSGTARGRVGFAMDRILPYLTAGLAVANASVHATDGPQDQSAMLTGWTAGGGIEVALDSNWSAKGEVLYTDLGTHTWFSGESFESTSHSTSTTVRAGINYRF